MLRHIFTSPGKALATLCAAAILSACGGKGDPSSSSESSSSMPPSSSSSLSSSSSSSVPISSSSSSSSSSVPSSSSSSSSVVTVSALFQDDFEGDAVGSLPQNWTFYHRYSQQNPSTQDISVVSDGYNGKGVKIRDIGGQAPNYIAWAPENPASISQLYMRVWMKPSRDIGNASGVNHTHFIATQRTPYSSNDAEFRFGEVKQGIGIGTSQPDDLAPSGQAPSFHSTRVIPANQWSCVEVGIHTQGADRVESWINGETLINVDANTPWQNGGGDEFMQDAFNLILFGWHGFSAPAVEIVFDEIVIATERVGCNGAVPTSSSSSSTSSSSSSTPIIPNDSILQADNHYLAPKAAAAPVIDGEVDAVWAAAPWMEMTVAWRTGFENLVAPSGPSDFTGKYKAIWTEDHVYLLFDITDDVINTSGQYWQQDTVEIFVDEDQSGGPHDHNHSAFAYHVSHNLEVVDNGGDIEGHISAAIKTQGNQHMWEIRMEIYADHNGYVPAEQDAARVKLNAGKIMGFTPSYIDNDGNGSREHFMSSVDTPGHQDNQGYINADSFGSIELIQ